MTLSHPSPDRVEADRAASSPAAGPLRRVGWTTTVGLAGAALVARLVYWWSTASDPLTSDARQYHELATHLAHGDGFAHQFPQLEVHATAFRPPAFPTMLSVVYRVTGSSVGVARLVAVLGGVILVVVTHRILLRHVSPLAATLGAALLAVYPPLVVNDTVPLTETLSLTLLVLLADRVVARSWAWSGLLCGLLILTRPSAQGLALVLAVWFWRSLGWPRALASLVVVGAVVAPWVVRNQIEVGEPTLVTSNGFNMAALYSAEAESLGAFVDPVYHPGFDDLRLAQFDEAAWDHALQRRAVDNLLENPWQVRHVVSRNALAIFELKPSFNEKAEEADARNMTVRAIALPSFYLITAIGAVGLALNRRTPLVAFLTVAALYFLVSSLFFVAPPRLRAPVDFACCIGAGLLVAACWSSTVSGASHRVRGVSARSS
jgi:hypothetical protein